MSPGSSPRELRGQTTPSRAPSPGLCAAGPDPRGSEATCPCRGTASATHRCLDPGDRPGRAAQMAPADGAAPAPRARAEARGAPPANRSAQPARVCAPSSQRGKLSGRAPRDSRLPRLPLGKGHGVAQPVGGENACRVCGGGCRQSTAVAGGAGATMQIGGGRKCSQAGGHSAAGLGAEYSLGGRGDNAAGQGRWGHGGRMQPRGSGGQCTGGAGTRCPLHPAIQPCLRNQQTPPWSF